MSLLVVEEAVPDQVCEEDIFSATVMWLRTKSQPGIGSFPLFVSSSLRSLDLILSDKSRADDASGKRRYHGLFHVVVQVKGDYLKKLFLFVLCPTSACAMIDARRPPL